MRKRLIIFLVLAAAGTAADLGTKAWSETFPRPGSPPMEIIPGLLNFIQTSNTGAAFGILHDRTWGPIVLIGVSILAIGFLVWFVMKTKERPVFHAVVCGLILGGVLGNVYDRITNEENAVRDFIDVYVTRPAESGGSDPTAMELPCGHTRADRCWHWYTFNLADAYISVGVILLLLLSFLPDRKNMKEKAA